MVDSDVLIDYLRDQPQAVAFLEGTEVALAISAITIAELYAGVSDGEERQQLDSFVAAFTVLPLDGLPAQRAGLWRRQYGPRDRRQRGGGRRHPGDPEPAARPDAGPGAGALRQGLISAIHLPPLGSSCQAMTALAHNGPNAPPPSMARLAPAFPLLPKVRAALFPRPARTRDPEHR